MKWNSLKIIISLNVVAILFGVMSLLIPLWNFGPSFEDDLRRQLRLHPDSLRRASDLAGYLRTDNQLPEAATLYEKIIRQHPEALSAYYHLGEVYLAGGRSREAVKLWQQVVAKTENKTDKYSVSWHQAASKRLAQIYDKRYA